MNFLITLSIKKEDIPAPKQIMAFEPVTYP